MPYTSNKKINALNLAPDPLGDTDAIPMVRAGVTFQTPLSAVEAKVFSAKTALSTSPLGTEVVILRQGDGSLRQTTTSSLIPDGNITNTQIGESAAIADTKLATISTTGKVSNSATTATSANTASAIVARDASGNFTAGTVTAALNGNASTATTLQTTRTVAISGDITGTATSFNGGANITIPAAITAGVIVDADINAAAGIVDTKLATIATAGKVSNSATTATSANTASAIVARDASGNFSAGTITATLNGVASSVASGVISDTNISSSAAISVSKLQYIPVQQGGGTGQSTNKIYIGWNGSNLATQVDSTNFGSTWPISIHGNAATATSIPSATSANTASAIVARDASGNFSAATATLSGISCSGAASTGNLTVTGAITASGNITAFSDERLKTNIQPIGNALAKVKSMRGVFFDRTDTGEHQVGVIAQEMLGVLPEVVISNAESGMLSVAYGNIVSVLIEAIKELAQEIESLKK